MPNLLAPRQRVPLYHSYLLRLWQDDLHLPWRAVTQSVQTGEMMHFADLESLFVFLQAQTSGETQADPRGASSQ